jgi:lipopolysaccharide/colanic/teichoic acid biosynthesis glycosyltransferase
LLVAFLCLVRHVWTLGRRSARSSTPWGACARTTQVAWAVVAVLSSLDPHLTMRGTGDLLFVLLAITVAGAPRDDAAPAGGPPVPRPGAAPPRGRGPERAARRARDLVVAAPALALLGVPMLAVGAVIRLTSPGRALFRQTRVGLGGEPFTMYKFRTMVPGGDDRAHRELIRAELAGQDTLVEGSSKLADDPRVTPLGAVLRRTSIDELPQLLNVLCGDMTLVGPRPCLEWEADLFPTEYAARFSVPPGITGLWQVSGRTRLTTPDMLALDTVYAAHHSLRTDWIILARTVGVLLRGDGAR